MDINNQLSSIFSSFIRDLSKTFPEIKNCLYRNYENEITNESINLEECPKIKEFLNKVKENEEFIKNKDESFFNKDFELLEGISFKRLWEKNISDKTKGIIWKYLQSFTIININLNSSDKLKDILESMKESDEISKDKIKDKKTAKDLQDLKKLTENISEPESTGDELDLENMLGGMMDSDIGKIAKEVAETMDFKSILGNVDESSNPMELMSQLLNPEKMNSIFQNINQVMDNKVKKGDLNPEDLKTEAENMYGNMSSNPMFSSMMNQMNQHQNNPESKKKDQEESKKEITKEEKKQKLREKIKEKQMDRK